MLLPQEEGCYLVTICSEEAPQDIASNLPESAAKRERISILPGTLPARHDIHIPSIPAPFLLLACDHKGCSPKVNLYLCTLARLNIQCCQMDLSLGS